jgi:hypothetical protein
MNWFNAGQGAIKAIFSTMKFFGSLGLARESSLMAQGR